MLIQHKKAYLEDVKKRGGHLDAELKVGAMVLTFGQGIWGVINQVPCHLLQLWYLLHLQISSFHKSRADKSCHSSVDSGGFRKAGSQNASVARPIMVQPKLPTIEMPWSNGFYCRKLIDLGPKQSQTHIWYHFGCVRPAILAALAHKSKCAHVESCWTFRWLAKRSYWLVPFSDHGFFLVPSSPESATQDAEAKYPRRMASSSSPRE